ncbi:3-oxoacyl-[acyl-carrier-protein] reductase FabG [subsurface metagenome]
MKLLKELFDLKNKVAFVTGGSGYLGSAMCEALAELGAIIIVGSRNKEKCRTFSKKLREKYNIIAFGEYVDITDVESIENILIFIERNFGRLDILINCAWSGNKNTFESISIEDWRYDIDVCLNGVFYTIKKAFPYLKKSKGIIVNITSMYGHIAPDYRIYEGTNHANPPSYGAAKAGVIQLTKYLASFLSPYGIRVNAISPGAFPFPELEKENKNFMNKLKEKSMLNRIGKPEDLKGIIALLCSEASSFITGQIIHVDGGWTQW